MTFPGAKMDFGADVYNDVQGLNKLKQAANNQGQEDAALKEVAKQFESIFTKMLLKSMREANDALASEDGMFNSDQMKFYRGMYDDQLSLNLSQDGGLGLADIIVQQLSPNVAPAPLNGSVVPALSAEALAEHRALTNTAKGVRSTQQWLNDVTYRAWQSNPAVRGQLWQRQISDLDNAKPAADRGPLEATPANVQQSEKTKKIAEIKSEAIKGFDNPDDFVKKLWPMAKKAAEKLHVDPKVILAQAALETGWGKSVIRRNDGGSSHNLFNIKADRRWDGPKVSVNTVEYKDGVAQKEMASFREYENFQKSFDDYVGFLQQSGRYDQALKHAGDPARFVHELQQAGYATDPSYANKIKGIYDSKMFVEALSSARNVKL